MKHSLNKGTAKESILANFSEQQNLEVTLNNKQNKLVSGTNIKTVNGESILGSGDITIEGGSGAYVENETLYLNAAESGSNSGSTGSGLTLIGNYLIEYSEEDAGYKVIHSIDTIPRTSLYVEIKNPEDGYAIFTGLLSYASATIINGYGYMFGTSISIPNANAALSLLWIVDPDFANSPIDLRVSISSNSNLVPLDGYIISVYTLN